MAIPSGNIKYWYDTSDPASYPGSGLVVYDLSGNGNDVTFNACIFQDPREVLLLTRNDFGQLDSSDIPSGNAVYTFEIWQKRDSATAGSPGFDAIFGVGLTGSNDRIINNTDTPAGSTALTVRTATGPADINGTFNLDWNHWVFLYDGTNGKIYLNGVQADTVVTGTQANGILRDTDNTNVACFNGLFYSGGPVGSGATRRYPGFIGEWGYFRIYDIALTAGQVLDQYNANVNRFYPPVTSLDFSDPACYSGSGSTAYDLVGSNNFDILATPTFVSDGQKSYFDFNGSNDRLVSIPVTLTTQTDFTFNCWAMNTSGNTNLQVLISAGFTIGAGGQPNIAFSVVNPNQINSSFGSGVSIALGSNISQNEWYMFTMTCDGTTNKIYVNGGLAGTAAQSTGTIYDNPTQFIIGQYSISDYSIPWIGRVATYDYYNFALDSGGVTNIFNSTQARFIPPPPPTIGLVGGRTFGQGFAG